jgi:hypothetical protein
MQQQSSPLCLPACRLWRISIRYAVASLLHYYAAAAAPLHAAPALEFSRSKRQSTSPPNHCIFDIAGRAQGEWGCDCLAGPRGEALQSEPRCACPHAVPAALCCIAALPRFAKGVPPHAMTCMACLLTCCSSWLLRPGDEGARCQRPTRADHARLWH